MFNSIWSHQLLTILRQEQMIYSKLYNYLTSSIFMNSIKSYT